MCGGFFLIYIVLGIQYGTLLGRVSVAYWHQLQRYTLQLHHRLINYRVHPLAHSSKLVT